MRRTLQTYRFHESMQFIQNAAGDSHGLSKRRGLRTH
uniref:Uncharacterized protein n=1 Tax=Anguilla anguilla TaxID=7936 RepID=A0A0E9RYB6_ANGAN